MSEFIRLQSKDKHNFKAYLSQPITKPKGGVIILQEIFGVNKHIQEITDLFSQHGYLSIAPCLYDRVEKNLDLEYTEEDITKGLELKSLCDKYALTEIEATIPVVLAAGKIGIIGYCWGGSLAWRSACKFKNLSAVITYYGGEIPSLRNLTPNCKVLSHFGEFDKNIPIDEVDDFLKAHKEVLNYNYPADHGFNCNYRSQFNKKCSDIALNRTLKFLQNNLI